MSIFGIILISLGFSLIIFLLGSLLVDCFYNEDLALIILSIISVIVLIACIFGGIGINTEDAIELVNKAAELNGELAERKASSELWHYVYYDKNVYAGLKPIVIK